MKRNGGNSMKLFCSRVLFGFFIGILWASLSGSLSALAATTPPSSVSTGGLRPSGSSGSGNFGLGVMLGEPTGLTLKSWTSGSTAFDVGVSYSFDHYVELLADYLWHFRNAFS